MAAACAAVGKRASYPDPQADQGHGLPQPGPHGSDRAGQLRSDHPLTSRPDPGLTNPSCRSATTCLIHFERQVTRTLAEGLAAARAGRAPGGVRPAAWKPSGRQCNLASPPTSATPWPASAAVSPAEGLGGAGRLVAHPAAPATRAPSRVFLGSDTIPLIQEAARLFRDTEPVEDVEIEGFVTRLARRPDQGPGEITLEGLVDGDLRRAGVELPETAYSLAVQAHESRQRVSCSGDLVKDRGGFRLENPRHFRLLDTEERA